MFIVAYYTDANILMPIYIPMNGIRKRKCVYLQRNINHKKERNLYICKKINRN